MDAIDEEDIFLIGAAVGKGQDGDSGFVGLGAWRMIRNASLAQSVIITLYISSILEHVAEYPNFGNAEVGLR